MTSFMRLGSLIMAQIAMVLLSATKKATSKKKTAAKKTTKKKAAVAKAVKEKSTTGGGDSGGDNDDQDDKKEDNKKEEESDSSAQADDQEDNDDQSFVSPWGVIEGGKSDKKEEGQQKKYDNLIRDLVGNKAFGKSKTSSGSGSGFGGGSNRSSNRGSGGGSNGGSGDDFFKKLEQSPKKILGILVLGLASLWLATGFYKVNSDENALVLYFGKFHTIATPGLNYALPAPLGKIVKQSVTTVNSEEFGYTGKAPTSRRFRSRNNQVTDHHNDNLMLTGDENIVDIEFQVQWQIKDIEKFTFNISEPRLTIRKAAESAMREVIAVTPISEALSDGKSRIEQDSKALLQNILDDYGAGIRIVLLQLRRVDPPPQVIDSFRDVQTAKADKEKEINEAQAYSNDIIPRARGNAAEMEEKAMAYKSRVIADASGEAKRFRSLYGQYKKAKEVTRRRMYLETMQKVYGDVDKVIIDSNLSKGSLMPYFPLGDLKNNSRNKAN